MKIALFPGSFDPITLGHIEIIERSLTLFDEIIIGLGLNSSKTTMFSDQDRKRWIEEYFADEKRVKVATFNNLTVEFAKENNAGFLVRGLRSAPDFEYEKQLQFLNSHLAPEVETVFLISSGSCAHISSTLVREVIKYKGKLEGLLPENIIKDIHQKYLL